MRRAEHRNPECTGSWLLYPACTDGHPGYLVCETCAAIVRATPERAEAALRDALLLVELELSLGGHL